VLFEFYVDWYMLLFYVAGTIFGLWVGRKMRNEEVVSNTIDYLIENRLVRWKEDPETGEIELLEIDDKSN